MIRLKRGDLHNLEVAVRLRVEALDDNPGDEDTYGWRPLLSRLQRALQDSGPAADCAKCKKGMKNPATHRIPDYFVGAARKKVGPDLFMCRLHALEYNQLHPLNRKAVPI